MRVRKSGQRVLLAASAVIAALPCLSQTQTAPPQTDQSQTTQDQTTQNQVTMPLSLKRAVDIALAADGNTRVAMAQELIEQARTQQLESKSAFLPDFDGSLNDRRETTNLQAFGFSFKLPIPGFSLPSIVGPFSVLDARLTAQQSIFNISDRHKYQAAKITALATATDAASTRNSVSDEVARDYLGCLLADATLHTAQANVELSQALRKLAQQQKDAGTGTGIEVTRADVQLANDRQSLIRAGNDRTRATLTLLKAMGLKMDAPVTFSSQLEFKKVDSASSEALLEQARKARPEFKTQQQREDAARLNVTSVKDERLPSLSAEADYGTIGSNLAIAHPTYTMGVSLRVPIFDGGRREARIGENASKFRQEQLRTRDLNQQVELQVRTALESLRSAEAEVQAATEGQTLSESELAQARRRYEAGVATSVEVTDAQTRLQRARDNFIKALYDHNVARLDLATATGTIGEYVNQ
jgi:outer membrane protein TolC